MANKEKYIPRQRDFIEQVMGDRLVSVKVGDVCTAEASGPQLVPVMQNGQQSMAVGWQLTVYLAHKKLIGQEPIFVSVPIGGILIDEATLVSITDRLLDQAREIRAKAENPAQPASMEEMMAAYQSGQNGSQAS